MATQIDGLGHAIAGDPPQAYNGITLNELSGDFGVRKLSAAGIPPIVNRAVLIDIARLEEVDALAIGSDTSGLEVPAPEGSTSFLPVHEYLLIQQGVHILEFHYLEDLARDGVWEFCYMATTNKIAGTTAGFALRPIALR